MANLAAKETADWLMQNVFLADHALLLTMLVEQNGVVEQNRVKVSINIDGPFRIARFFPGKIDEEDVIEPVFATRRRQDDPETNVHMHVTSWPDLHWCRVWHVANARVGYDCRICFFATKPGADERGPELFWFYAKADHPLAKSMPPKHGKFSDPLAIPQPSIAKAPVPSK
jgi:hypothetical protein